MISLVKVNQFFDDVMEIAECKTFGLEVCPSGNWQAGERTLSVTITYDKGGMNWYNHREDKRGYRLLVTQRELLAGGSYRVIPMADVNFRWFLHEVTRKSDKGYREACQVLEEAINAKGDLYQRLMASYHDTMAHNREMSA